MEVTLTQGQYNSGAQAGDGMAYGSGAMGQGYMGRPSNVSSGRRRSNSSSSSSSDSDGGKHGGRRERRRERKQAKRDRRAGKRTNRTDPGSNAANDNWQLIVTFKPPVY